MNAAGTGPAFAALARKPCPAPADGTDGTAPQDGTAGGTGATALAPEAGGTGAADAVPCADLVPLLAAPQRLGFAARLMRRTRCRMVLIADYQRRHNTFAHAVTVFITRPPETWAETGEHLESRKWLQDWMTGCFRTFCEWENLAWGHLVSMPAKAVLQLVEKVFFERQLGFWLGLGAIGTCILIWHLAQLLK